MRLLKLFVFVCASINKVICCCYYNDTAVPDAASQQLSEFRRLHSKPIGVLTKITGEPMDIRDTLSLNSEIFDNRHHFRTTSHINRERIPERVVHAKGVGAFGYFELTHDISRYTKADVFNGVGKRTPVMARFSTAIHSLGGSDVNRDIKAIALKMYTIQGNLDFITFHIPVFIYKDPIDFTTSVRAFRRNPRSSVFENNIRNDFINLRPDDFIGNLWIMTDLGIPDGYRKTNYFPLHAYEIYNKEGERFFVKFNFRSEIGLYNLTNAQAAVLRAEDPEYFNRDLFNAIAAGNYPAWRLDMDILTAKEITTVDYDPFDMTRLWKKEHTVPYPLVD